MIKLTIYSFIILLICLKLKAEGQSRCEYLCQNDDYCLFCL